MFTSDWFPKQVFEEHLASLKSQRASRILEIGAFEGRGTTYFLEHYTAGGGLVIAVDPFIPYSVATLSKIPDGSYLINEETMARFLANTSQWAERLVLLRSLSKHVLPMLGDETFDLVFVDGDHSCAAVARDARDSFRVTKGGGYIVFDDYLWGSEFPPESRPKDAIDQFLADYADRISVVHKANQVVVRKL